MNKRMFFLGIGIMIIIGLVVGATNPSVGSILGDMLVQTSNGQAYQIIDKYETTTITQEQCLQPKSYFENKCTTIPGFVETKKECNTIIVIDSNTPVYSGEEIIDYDVVAHEDLNCYDTFIQHEERQECVSVEVIPEKQCNPITRTVSNPVYRTIFEVIKDSNNVAYMDINSGLVAGSYLTKSKLVIKGADYFKNLADINKITTKTGSYAVVTMNDKNYLDLEARVVELEGFAHYLMVELCNKSGSYSFCSKIK